MTALLVSLVNLSLSCYPDRLEYVDQVLGFAKAKIAEFADKSVHWLLGFLRRLTLASSGQISITLKPPLISFPYYSHQSTHTSQPLPS